MKPRAMPPTKPGLSAEAKKTDANTNHPGSYVKRVSNCSCLTSERKGFIASALLFSEDFPDGAFFAYMEEEGIDVSELEPFTEGHKCPKAPASGPVLAKGGR